MRNIRFILGVAFSALALILVQGLVKSSSMIGKISGKNKITLAGGHGGGDTPGRRGRG